MKTVNDIYDLLSQVPDPEVPVLNILDLGIVRSVTLINENFTITITPTYTGCPAMDMIKMNIQLLLLENGINNAQILLSVNEIWTTDWMTDAGKQKLKAYGIAPPQYKTKDSDLYEDVNINCPICNSTNTKELSRFGSTACKALHQCNDCKEPFDYFKCH